MQADRHSDQVAACASVTDRKPLRTGPTPRDSLFLLRVFNGACGCATAWGCSFFSGKTNREDNQSRTMSPLLSLDPKSSVQMKVGGTGRRVSGGVRAGVQTNMQTVALK